MCKAQVIMTPGDDTCLGKRLSKSCQSCKTRMQTLQHSSWLIVAVAPASTPTPLVCLVLEHSCRINLICGALQKTDTLRPFPTRPPRVRRKSRRHTLFQSCSQERTIGLDRPRRRGRRSAFSDPVQSTYELPVNTNGCCS